MSDGEQPSAALTWKRLGRYGVILLGILGIVYLFLGGAELGWVADLGAFAVSLVGLYLTSMGTARGRDAAVPMSRRARLWTIVVTVVGGLLIAGIWTHVRFFSDIDVDMGAPVQVTHANMVTVKPVTPLEEGTLRFTVRLAEIGRLGDCVLPASLVITPVVNGTRLPQREVRHGGYTSVPLPDEVHTFQLEVRYVTDFNPDCGAQVSLVDAELIR